MKTKYYNDAVIGNKKVTATYSNKGELLRIYYPSVDYKQLVEYFYTGIKINDSSLIYLHEDMNNRYRQYYTEDTNILNTEIENTYFKLKIKQTDFIPMKENVLIKRYIFVNENSIDLNIDFLVHSKLLSNSNDMISAKKIERGMIQYNHEYSFSTFASQKTKGHRINDTNQYIYEAQLEDKDYIGMSSDSGISYQLGNLKPGDQVTIDIYLMITENEKYSTLDKLEEEITRVAKLEVVKEYNATKKYWKKYVEDHNKLVLRSNSTQQPEKIKQIYQRTILLFALLMNHETGGIAASLEVDEEREKSGRYSYCWPRDAVFITKALDELGMIKETEKFYKNFCKNTQSKNGMWEQRFYTDGRLAPCWGYQIDETASVVFGIYEHYQNTKDSKFLKENLKMCENAVHFLLKYCNHLLGKKEEIDIVRKEIEEKAKELGKETDKIYQHPSYDLWEMNEGVHLYSLASIFAAFNAMIEINGILKPEYETNRLKQEQMIKETENMKQTATEIKRYVLDHMYDDISKTLNRNIQDKRTDISIIGAVVPFNMFTAKEKKVLNTVEKINLTLRTYTNGYLRFEEDSYMGGKNPWPVATLWMALYYIQAGDKKKAKECFNFVVKTATEHGFLAEQIDNTTMKSNWVIGLGWSHAMFILVLKLLNE